jgi:hypothetical protein
LIVAYIASGDFRPHTGADLQVLFVTETAREAVRCLISGDRRAIGDNVVTLSQRAG